MLCELYLNKVVLKKKKGKTYMSFQNEKVHPKKIKLYLAFSQLGYENPCQIRSVTVKEKLATNTRIKTADTIFCRMVNL